MDKLHPVSWSKTKGFVWDDDGFFYCRSDVDQILKYLTKVEELAQEVVFQYDWGTRICDEKTEEAFLDAMERLEEVLERKV
jgi:hypothetical protein